MILFVVCDVNNLIIWLVVYDGNVIIWLVVSNMFLFQPDVGLMFLNDS